MSQRFRISIAFLGFLRIYRANVTIDVKGMNHLGCLAFLISGDPRKSDVILA